MSSRSTTTNKALIHYLVSAFLHRPPVNNHRSSAWLFLSLTSDSAGVPLAPSMLTAWPRSTRGNLSSCGAKEYCLGVSLCTDVSCGKTDTNLNSEELYLSDKSVWNWLRVLILILFYTFFFFHGGVGKGKWILTRFPSFRIHFQN